jgi:outer membrane protein TolC
MAWEFIDGIRVAQKVNLDIAAATARFIQADAQARVAGAALLPSLNGTGQETYSRTSGSSASGLTNGGREVADDGCIRDAAGRRNAGSDIDQRDEIAATHPITAQYL